MQKETGTTLQINHTSTKNKNSFVISRIYSNYIVILSYRQFRYQTFLKVHICSNTSDIFGNNLRITGILCCSCAILSMSDTQKTTTDWTDTHLCLMSASDLSSSWARCMSSHKHWMLLQKPVLFQHTSQWLWGCNSSDCPLPPANFRSFPKQSALFLNH